MEEEIAKCPIVEHAVVVGDGRPFIGALVTLDPEGLASWLPTIGQPADLSLDAQFTQENSCLTPSLKVVRPAVNRVFSGAIDQELYAGKR